MTLLEQTQLPSLEIWHGPDTTVNGGGGEGGGGAGGGPGGGRGGSGGAGGGDGGGGDGGGSGSGKQTFQPERVHGRLLL